MAAGPVMLLGVRATACTFLSRGERERRWTLDVGPVAGSALLDRLLDLAADESVAGDDSVSTLPASRLPPSAGRRAG
jgi:hypothetical protein